MIFRSFAEYVAWKEGLFYTDQPVKSSIGPNAVISPEATPPKDGQLKPVKLPKPKAIKPPPIRLPALKVGQRLGIKAKYPH